MSGSRRHPAAPTVTGRVYHSTRPRGFAPWRPQARTEVLLEDVRAVLEEYAELLPITGRQLFYRLVGRFEYPKDERSYERLLNALNLGRRAGLIPFESIRDDGATCESPSAFYGLPHFWCSVAAWASDYRRDRLEGQPRHVEVWCEAGGMVPQLARVADPFGIAVYSSGGFDSLTVKRNAAERLGSAGRPALILHVGDFDPSGCAIVDSLAEDVRAMMADLGYAEPPAFERVAVTPEQIRRYRLPEAPVKATDRRGGWHGGTVQAEALAPDVLAELLRQAIVAATDAEALAVTVAREERERGELLRRLEAVAADDAG